MPSHNSESLSLRPVRKSDFENIFAWENDEKNWIQSGIIKAYNVQEIKQYVSKSESLKKDFQTRYILELPNKTVVGCVDLFDYKPVDKMASVGLLISEQYREKGYGTKALIGLELIARKEHSLKKLKAMILTDNFASVQLFKKNGFLSDDTKAKIYTYRGVDYLQMTYFKTI